MERLASYSQKARELLFKGQKRSVKAKKNILLSFMLKGGNIAISFFLVPLTINYVNENQYGIWLTISSIVLWFQFFDVGLGNGLRNKFAEALAKNDKIQARIYVSTTYAILAIISVGILLLFLAINPLLNWAQILEVPLSMTRELQVVMLIVVSFFCINFTLKLITTIATANQEPALSGTVNFITNFLSLLLIWILTQTTQGSLINLSWVLSVSPVLVLLLASIWLFSTRYRPYTPQIKYVDFSQFKSLMNLGIKFFFIQAVGVIIFSTDNFIIIKLFSPTEVTEYNIAFKYFGIVTKVFAIVCTPFWSAYTEAYHNNDQDWIKRTNKRLVQFWVLLALMSILMLIGSQAFYRFWVPEVSVGFWLSFFMCVYVNYLNWGSIYVLFVNGVGKVYLQLVFAVIGGILNIPLSIIFAKHLGLGPAGVILATTICILHGGILMPIQYKKIITNTAKGIWNK